MGDIRIHAGGSSRNRVHLELRNGESSREDEVDIAAGSVVVY